MTDEHRERIEYLAAKEVECHCDNGQYSPDKPETIPHESCNGSGKVPMFPMLRITCHIVNTIYCDVHDRGKLLCDRDYPRGYEPNYTVAPMSDLLDRILQLEGWTYWLDDKGARVYIPNYGSHGSNLTGYKGLIAALEQALRAMEAAMTPQEMIDALAPQKEVTWMNDVVDHCQQCAALTHVCASCGYCSSCHVSYCNADDYEDDTVYVECSCRYCFCMESIEGGGTCNSCLAGAHQG